MLPQTKRAHDALRSVGLKQGEFSTQCPLTRRGYGDVEINLSIPLKRQYELAEQLATKFDVTVFTIDGKPRGPVLVNECPEGKEKLTIRRVDNEQQ